MAINLKAMEEVERVEENLFPHRFSYINNKLSPFGGGSTILVESNSSRSQDTTFYFDAHHRQLPSSLKATGNSSFNNANFGFGAGQKSLVKSKRPISDIETPSYQQKMMEQRNSIFK